MVSGISCGEKEKRWGKKKNEHSFKVDKALSWESCPHLRCHEFLGKYFSIILEQVYVKESRQLISSHEINIQDLRLTSITVAWAVRTIRYHPFPRYSRIVFLLMSCPEDTPSSVYKNIFAQWLFHKELTFISQWKSIWFSLKGKKRILERWFGS